MHYSVSNENGMKLETISTGAAIKNLLVPDRDGKLRDVVLGYDDEETYRKGNCAYGAFVGRYANRIGGASFTLDEKEYKLTANEGNNFLHGSFIYTDFDAEVNSNRIIYKGVSSAGEDGFPGNLNIRMEYKLTRYNELVISYEASCDEPTVLNLTNHSYFNLNGDDHSTILNHHMCVMTDEYTELDKESIPTGNILKVDKGPLDFRKSSVLHGGIDHNYVFGKTGEMKMMGTLFSPKTGIAMEFYSDQPGVQIYTGNYIQLDDSRTGKGGKLYPKFGGVAIETGHYPDSPNKSEFPTTVLRPGEVFKSKTIYKFLVK